MNLHYELPLQRLGKYPQALEARIIEVAKQQGGEFYCTPRYRDAGIARACERLVRKDVFTRTKRGLFPAYKLKSV